MWNYIHGVNKRTFDDEKNTELKLNWLAFYNVQVLKKRLHEKSHRQKVRLKPWVGFNKQLHVEHLFFLSQNKDKTSNLNDLYNCQSFLQQKYIIVDCEPLDFGLLAVQTKIIWRHNIDQHFWLSLKSSLNLNLWDSLLFIELIGFIQSKLYNCVLHSTLIICALNLSKSTWRGWSKKLLNRASKYRNRNAEIEGLQVSGC